MEVSEAVGAALDENPNIQDATLSRFPNATMSTKATRQLEIAEDVSFEKKSWIFHQAGLAVLAIFVALGLTGVFGGGGVGTGYSTAGPLNVEAQRFLRRSTQSEIAVRLPNHRAGTPEIRLNKGFVDSIVMNHILPLPLTISDAGPTRVYRFRPTDEGEQIVVFSFTPKSLGPGVVRIEAGDSRVTLSQFVYP